MGRRVVVFDLDGTLSNPLEGFARSINHALRLQGLPEREPQALARYIGPPLHESAVELSASDDPTVHTRLIADYSGGDIGVHKWQQLQALREAGAVDAQSVMVGERDVDITSAHRTGLHACGVLWGFGSREELLAESPRHLAETPADLRRLFDGAPS